MNNKGFTLIELLTVISIMAILSAIALVTFPAATGRARDARVINGMQQLRTAAEVVRGIHGNYAQVTRTGSTDPTIVTLVSEIETQSGNNIVITLDTAAGPAGVNGGYCAHILMRGGTRWCVDSDLTSRDVGTAAPCQTANSRCPTS